MARIENHKFTIEEAFRECFYEVPDYQREYVWKEANVQQLIDDIDEQLSLGSNKEYFVGTILVAPTQDKNHYEVIDGQQRLTTFFLLLCVLRILLGEDDRQKQALSGLITTSYIDKGGEVKSSLKLLPKYEGAEPVIKAIVDLHLDPADIKPVLKSKGLGTFGSLENLVNAYATIHAALKEKYPTETSLKKFWGYLANNVVFIQISSDVSSALKIFETINERGVGLSPMDLLKNLLFTQVTDVEFTKLKDEWKKITSPLEKEKEKPLRFLRYFLMANYPVQNERNDGVIREDEIYEWLTDDGNAASCGYRTDPFGFVAKLALNVGRYIAFKNGRGPTDHDSPAMTNLRRLAGSSFSLHHVLLLASADLPEALFEHLVGQLEKFLFYYIFTKSPTRDLEKSFAAWADELRVIAAMRVLADQKKKLNEFIANRFQKNMSAKEAELRDTMKRFTFYTMQKYRLRYLLAKLTQFVDDQYQGVKTQASVDQYKGLEIEHILPEDPEDELRETFESNPEGMKYSEGVERLGNLALLEKPINIVASNSFFEDKKAELAKSKNYLTSSIVKLNVVGNNTSINRINGKLMCYDTWNAASIISRQEKLVDLVIEVWEAQPIP